MPDSRVDEAISVVARRQRWALEQKLEEVSLPGALAATVADRHGRSRSLLFEWRRQVRKGAMPGIVRAKAAPALVPVRIVEDAPKKTPRPRLPSRGSPERPGKVGHGFERPRVAGLRGGAGAAGGGAGGPMLALRAGVRVTWRSARRITASANLPLEPAARHHLSRVKPLRP